MMGNIPEHSVAHSVSVRLVWWMCDCCSNRKPKRIIGFHWSCKLPVCREVIVECLGSTNRTKTNFRVDCVTPRIEMPALHVDEKSNFVDVLQAGLEAETGLRITGLTQDVVDWDGILII